MKILITSGGTREYIDDVRVLTNISSGKLGAQIATVFAEAEHDVHYLHAKGAIVPDNTGDDNVTYHTVDGTQEVFELMKELVPQMDVVIHAMAVSDFGFKRDGAVKLKSNDPEAFIEFMRENIIINPKILSYIKTWNPEVFLVSFKFEVGQTHKGLIEIAHDSLTKNGSDLVIANDKEEMIKENSHITHFVWPDKKVERAYGKLDTAVQLYKIVCDKN